MAGADATIRWPCAHTPAGDVQDVDRGARGSLDAERRRERVGLDAERRPERLAWARERPRDVPEDRESEARLIERQRDVQRIAAVGDAVEPAAQRERARAASDSTSACGAK